MRPLKAMWCAVAAVVLLAGASAVAVADPVPGSIRVDDFTYPTSHGPQPMTVYRPSTGNSHNPGLIFVHGGAWITGHRGLLDNEARQAAERGFVVFNIDYDESSPRYPREYQDVESAINHIRTQATQFALDPDRLGGLGTSAGANLIMQAVITDHTPLRAAVGWSGPYDLTNRRTPHELLLTSLAAATYLECLPLTPQCTDRAAAASPTLHTPATNPPIMLFNSSDELVPVDQMRDFADALRAHGATVRTQLLPGSRHAVKYAGDAIGPTIDFLTLNV